ncbi:hypothetical protein BG004_005181 [Podila humilis]|nr:hypothetical protein BG004_005181 [Podila humilis]
MDTSIDARHSPVGQSGANSVIHKTNGSLSMHSSSSSLNSTHHHNGSRTSQQPHHQDDAIVPASVLEHHDDNTDEDDDEYNSYLQDQEQKELHYIQQDISHEDEYLHQQQKQQQQNLHAYKSQAMNISQLLHQDKQFQYHQHKDMNADMDLDTDDEFEHEQAHYDHGHELNHNGLQVDDDDSFDDDDHVLEEAMDEDMLDDEEEDDEGSETISLTEDDIDFNLVYAFHTFVATQEGQASVVRNDSLMLLEDTNVYWWLVRVLKTGVIGYIPAENIETPFERLARLNTYRNVALSAPTSEWGTFDENIQPLDPSILAQTSTNRRSVIFTTQNDYLEASETEWTDEEEEEGDGYSDEDEDDEEEEVDEDDEEGGVEHDDHELVQEEEDEEEEEFEQLEADDDILDDDEDDYLDEEKDNFTQATIVTSTKIQEPWQRVPESIHTQSDSPRNPSGQAIAFQQQSYQQPAPEQQNEGPADSEDEEVMVTNRYRKPLLDDVDLMFANTEPRVISLTPPIARDDAPVRMQTPPGKSKPSRRASEDQPSSIVRRLSESNSRPGSSTQSSSPLSSLSKPVDARSPSFDSEDDDREHAKISQEERTAAKLNAILGKNTTAPPAPRLTKEEYEAGLPPEAPVVKKPGKFKSLFGVGKSSKEKERKEKERQEKERLKKLAKTPVQPATINTNNNLFRTRSNSSGTSGPQAGNVSNSTLSNFTPLSPTSPLDKCEPHHQDILTLRVYPGNVDFGASMYKTVVVTPTTMASDVAHQAVIKFRLAPDGAASTGDFFLTVRGVDGDDTVLQPTDKPMMIYQSLTAHLTTPLPANHRLSISSVSSMMSANSASSHSSHPQQPTLRRTGSGRGDQQQRSIRFLLNKKIRRASAISLSSMPTSPTTPTAPQEDFFWVKVVCQAQDLPQSMLLLDGMGTALEKTSPHAVGQSLATKVEHWIPMHATSNAGDVIFKTLERVGIRSGVVDGVPEQVLIAKRATVPSGLVIEYQLGLKLNSTSSRKNKQGDEVALAPQVPLSRCFEEHQLIPVRRSPKADVASMPLHPDHTFFLRKAPKSLQAEMKCVQEQLLQNQQRTKQVPAPLQARALRSDTSAHPNPTGMVSPRSESSLSGAEIASPTQIRSLNNQTVVGGNRTASGAASPIRIPRRTDSVILSPTSPIRGASFESGRPSPTLSAQSLLTTQAIHHPQMSRTPTPDHAAVGARACSPSAQGTSPGSLRGLQAPSPAPSNLSSNMGASITGTDQDGSRSSTPDRPARFDRPDRQRATSPSLTHGPSPLSMSAILHDADTNQASGPLLSHASERPDYIKGSFSTGESSSFHHLSKNAARFSIQKNSEQGVDIVLNKGALRSVKLQSSSSSLSSSYYRYIFTPLGGDEDIDVSEILEDILGGDASDSDVDQDVQQQHSLDEMTRRERTAAAVARASKLVAASKERRRASRRASASSQSNASPLFAKQSSKWADRDRLEFLASSARGGDTLMKLERALTGDTTGSTGSTGAVDASSGMRSNGPYSRNLPSPMSLNSASVTPSPSHNRRSSDVEVQSAISGSRNQSPMSTVVVDASEMAGILGDKSSPPSPLSRRQQTPSPAPATNNRQILSSIQTTVAPSSGLSSATITRSASGSPSFACTRTRSASASVAEISRLDTRVLTSPTTVTGHDPWLLSSDYNTDMQALLTLVRGGRSSSVSHIHASSVYSSRVGLVFGRDGKIVTSTGQKGVATLSSPSSFTSINSFSSRNERSKTTQDQSPSSDARNNNQDTQGDESSTGRRRPYEYYDDNNMVSVNTHSSLSSPASSNTFHTGRAGSSTSTELDRQFSHANTKVWPRTDARLQDVRRECHPEVFDCWREVDADLKKVEKELDTLLATVKATSF